MVKSHCENGVNVARAINPASAMPKPISTLGPFFRVSGSVLLFQAMDACVMLKVGPKTRKAMLHAIA